MNRRTNTLLPTKQSLLQPNTVSQYHVDNEMLQQKQQFYYNQGTKDLQPLKNGDVVRIRWYIVSWCTSASFWFIFTCKVIVKFQIFIQFLLIEVLMSLSDVTAIPMKVLCPTSTSYTNTLLPTKQSLLQPNIVSQYHVHNEMLQQKQQFYYNQGTKDLQPLKNGDVVRIQPSTQTNKEWKKGYYALRSLVI
jgi:hypothetical protein